MPSHKSHNRGSAAEFAVYAGHFPSKVRRLLASVRRTIRRAVPEASEMMRYNMPAFILDGQVIIYFAAFKKHIGLYPPVRKPAHLKRAAAPYAGPKGNLQLPYAEPIPLDLIERIVKSRAATVRRRPARSAAVR